MRSKPFSWRSCKMASSRSSASGSATTVSRKTCGTKARRISSRQPATTSRSFDTDQQQGLQLRGDHCLPLQILAPLPLLDAELSQALDTHVREAKPLDCLASRGERPGALLSLPLDPYSMGLQQVAEDRLALRFHCRPRLLESL